MPPSVQDEPTACGVHRSEAKGRLVTLAQGAAKPVRAVGDFFAMSLDTLVQMFRPPFARREFLLQTWFVARVSLVPTIMLAIPFTVLAVFTINILLVEIGAADLSGTGAALGAVTQIGPVVTVLVIAGAGATAMCADLGARTIREELDAMRVLGINPIQALVVPRVLAATVVSLMLASLVSLVGIVGGFFFSVYFQHVTPGAFAAGLTLLVGTQQVLVAPDQSRDIRPGGEPDRLLQGHVGRWRTGRRGQRRQRDRGVHLHGAVRDQRHRHSCRREGDDVMVATAQQAESADIPHPSSVAPRLGIGWASRPSSTGKRCAARRDALLHYRIEVVRLIAQMSSGHRRACGHRRHRGHRRFSDAVGRFAHRDSGVQPAVSRSVWRR